LFDGDFAAIDRARPHDKAAKKEDELAALFDVSERARPTVIRFGVMTPKKY